MYQTTFYGELDPPQYDETPSGDPACGANTSSTAGSSGDFFGSGSANASTTNTSATISASGSNTVASRAASVAASSRAAPTASTAATTASGDAIDPDTSSDSIIVADERTTTWRETILDNIHQLRNMSDSDNPSATSLEILVHFTAEVGEAGKVPTHIDPLNFEYKQGDFLNGYVLIRNKGTSPIPFDMFYVLFEGNFIVSNSAAPSSLTPVKIRKFLEMYDFAASWNHALVNRLLCENAFEQGSTTPPDPVDGAHLCMGMSKQVQPGKLYKRFFTFKIPERLLDSECHDHNLPGHTQLPPTLGLSRRERMDWAHLHAPVDDLLFIDTATNYGVLARFIGKARKYGWEPARDASTRLINAEGDEFVICKELVAYVRILQELPVPLEQERAAAVEASRVMFHNFLLRVDQRIAVGHELKKAIESSDNGRAVDIATRLAAEEAVDARDDAAKARQLYIPCTKRDCESVYRVLVPVTKRSVFGHDKHLGTFWVETASSEYLLNYILPQRFRYGEPVDDTAWRIQVPLEVTYAPSSAVSKTGAVPEIRHVAAEFVAFTLKSNKRPIPVELNHDFLFRNGPRDPGPDTMDNFTHLVKRPLRKRAAELYGLVNELGVDNFRVEKSLVEDLSAMANLEEKYNNLVLHDVEVVDVLGKHYESSKGIRVPLGDPKQNYSRKFSVCVDIAKALKKQPNQPRLKPGYKSYDHFTLVPSFQTCLLSRMYYLRIMLCLLSDQIVYVKVPVSIAKMPSN